MQKFCDIHEDGDKWCTLADCWCDGTPLTQLEKIKVWWYYRVTQPIRLRVARFRRRT